MIESPGVLPSEPATKVRLGGATFVVDARAVLGSECALARLRRQVFSLLADGSAACITILCIGTCADAADEFADICAALAEAAAGSQAILAQLDLALAATVLAPADVLAIRHEYLGPGRINLLADAGLFRPAVGEADRATAFWHDLWRLRDVGDVVCTFAETVASVCPLLSAQKVTALQPQIALQCPAGSAWVCATVDVAACADGRGHIDIPELTRQLETAVDAGDVAHDTASWPTAAMRDDAWCNRRLGILLTGLGDVAQQMGDSPADWRCLLALSDLVRRIRAILVDRSREIAQRTGVLPALAAHDPVPKLGATVRPAWQARWDRALKAVGTRHRNLLVMSPASVLPRGRPVDARYFDLLPLLEHADAWSAPPTALLQQLDALEFRELHQRSWAVLQRSNGRRLIAEQV